MNRKIKTIRKSLRFRRWSRKAVSVFISCTSHVTIGRVSKSIADASCRKSAKPVTILAGYSTAFCGYSTEISCCTEDMTPAIAVLCQKSCPTMPEEAFAGIPEQEYKPKRQYPGIPGTAAILFSPCYNH